ncbi:DUF6173 family protein [Sulfitobacter sp. D35]|uniref:DUF6173 family protein n=1 Tax=Sulfitobacter sp. D35 TaxID=3083252 RepID=UPI0029700661|nr:DUF6173 family protein [Sulfitobacter sp. D35]MDW4499779.1 DUF6173 family protein [Sulfitobacter sp. D35]
MSDEISTTAELVEADALPKVHEVHCEPGASALCNEILPKQVAEKPVKTKSPAQWAYERIILYLKNFEKQLDSDHEVAMGFTGGQAGVLRIEGMGYFDPDIVTFYGRDDKGAKTQFIQHVSQLSVMLRALPKPTERKEPNRIGFRLAQDLDAEA